MEKINVSGIVTDANGNPLEGADVSIKGDLFEELFETVTDKEGKFKLNVPKGKYLNLYACKEYKVNFLEYWFWDFAPEKDIELNIKIDKLEVYGLKAWSPFKGWLIYFRPMSLTLQKERNAKGAFGDYIQIAPKLTKKDIVVTIDNHPVEIYRIDMIKEHSSVKDVIDAYLLQVADLPKELKSKGQKVVTVTIHDRERNEMGMGSTFTKTHNCV